MSAFLFIILLVLIICCTFVVVVSIIRGLFSRTRGKLDQEETQMIQQLHRQLTKLESRMEALETIFLEIERKKEKPI